MKFGGTSVQDSEAFSRVAGIVASRAQDHPVVVVSAMSGFTNALLDSFGRASKGDFDEALKTVDRHLIRHRDVALSLLAESDFREFEDFLDKSKTELIELLQPRPQGSSTQSYP